MWRILLLFLPSIKISGAFDFLNICQALHYLHPARLDISKYSIGTGLALAVHQMIAVLNLSNEIVPTSAHTVC